LRGAATVSMQFRHFAYLGILRYEDTTGCLPLLDDRVMSPIGTKRHKTMSALMSAPGGKAECAGRPARSRWCKSITMKK
jgi:hypothetical protein